MSGGQTTSLQDQFIQKATATLQKISSEWLAGASLSPKDFTQKYYQNKKEIVDQRTAKFIDRMMDGVKEAVLRAPGYTRRMLEITFERPEDDEAVSNCLYTLSEPHLSQLKEELDKINPSIIDDIIASK